MDDIISKLNRARQTGHDPFILAPEEEGVLRHRASQGDITDKFWLGYYLYQLDAPSVLDEARALLEEAAAHGHPAAMTTAAELRMAGDPLAQCTLFRFAGNRLPRLELLQHLEAASASGYCEAMIELGEVYYRGEVVPQDWITAIELFERSHADSGIVADTAWLVIMHAEGQGVVQDAAKAVCYLTEKASEAREAGLDSYRRSLSILCESVATRYEARSVLNVPAHAQLARAGFWLWQCVRLGETSFVPRIAALAAEQMATLGQADLTRAIAVPLSEVMESCRHRSLDWPSSLEELNE